MIQLRILGTADLRDDDGGNARALLVQPKRFAVLAYLAAALGAFHRRDTLLGLFWAELDESHARNALNKTVHHLRRALGERVIVSRGEEELGLDPDRLACDVTDFERALDRKQYAAALQLYRGDLLQGFFLADAREFERWIEERRSALRARAAEAAWALAQQAETEARADDAAEWGLRACAFAPDEERALRRVVALLDGLGDRARALRTYDDFARRLAGEFDTEPAPETQALVRAIRDRTHPVQAPNVVPSNPAPIRSQGRESIPTTARTPRERFETNPHELSFGRFGRLSAPRVGWRRPRAVIGAFAGLALLLTVASQLRRARTVVRVADDSAIAVLPFVNMSADGQQEYVADGLTEELTNALAQAEGLRVASRTAAFGFKRRAAPTDSIGRALDVAHIVEGSVRVAGQRVRITAQLIDVADGYHRWSRTYDRELRDVLDVQEEIARAIADALRLRLDARSGRSLSARPTRDAEAYDLYLRGRYLWRQRTAETVAQSIAHFERAIERDSAFALAYVGLADAHAVLPAFSATPAAEARARARAAVTRALELDSTLAEAHVTVASLMGDEWDWVGADRHFARAVDLAPGYATAHQWYGEHLTRMGRFADALRELRKAQRLDPVSGIIASQVGWALMSVGDHSGAITEFERAIAIAPQLAHVYEGLGSTYREMGRYAEAEAAFRRALQVSPDRAITRGFLGSLEATLGRDAEARRLLAELRSPDAPANSRAWAIAMIYAGLGERDSALRWFHAA